MVWDRWHSCFRVGCSEGCTLAHAFGSLGHTHASGSQSGVAQRSVVDSCLRIICGCGKLVVVAGEAAHNVHHIEESTNMSDQPLDYSGHQPLEDRRIDPSKPADYSDFDPQSGVNRPLPQQVRGYGQVPNPVEYPPVKAERSKPVKQARDRAQYVRQQKGHSWLLHWLILGVFTMWIVPIHYSFSPNHYWHI